MASNQNYFTPNLMNNTTHGGDHHDSSDDDQYQPNSDATSWQNNSNTTMSTTTAAKRRMIYPRMTPKPARVSARGRFNHSDFGDVKLESNAQSTSTMNPGAFLIDRQTMEEAHRFAQSFEQMDANQIPRGRTSSNSRYSNPGGSLAIARGGKYTGHSSARLLGGDGRHQSTDYASRDSISSSMDSSETGEEGIHALSICESNSQAAYQNGRKHPKRSRVPIDASRVGSKQEDDDSTAQYPIRTKSARSAASTVEMTPEELEEYQQRRKRNNEAVRKSRQKAKSHKKQMEDDLRDAQAKCIELQQRCEKKERELEWEKEKNAKLEKMLEQERMDK